MGYFLEKSQSQLSYSCPLDIMQLYALLPTQLFSKAFKHPSDTFKDKLYAWLDFLFISRAPQKVWSLLECFSSECIYEIFEGKVWYVKYGKIWMCLYMILM